MSKSLSTQMVHAGEEKRKPYGALTTPVAQSSAFTFRNTDEILEYMQDKANGKKPLRDEYGRFSNPTERAAEGKIAALEGGERALLFASGMCAITTTMLAMLKSGDHLIMSREGFYITRDFARALLSRWGIETTLIPINQPEALLSAIRPETRLFFAEIPTNPYLRVLDLT